MQLEKVVENVLGELSESLYQLSENQYYTPCKHLSNASIGQHVRHVVELFQCLLNGYETGLVNYEKRKRDTKIETDKGFAVLLLQDIVNAIDRVNKDLNIEVALGHDAEGALISSNYFREVLYNIEHAIHHMALIRVGVQEMTDIVLPESYGVAPSTIQHRQACAQ